MTLMPATLRPASQRISAGAERDDRQRADRHQDRGGERREPPVSASAQADRRCRRPTRRSTATTTCRALPRVAQKRRQLPHAVAAQSRASQAGTRQAVSSRHGDADVGRGERAGVVQAVADHQHAVTGRPAGGARVASLSSGDCWKRSAAVEQRRPSAPRRAPWSPERSQSPWPAASVAHGVDRRRGAAAAATSTRADAVAGDAGVSVRPADGDCRGRRRRSAAGRSRRVTPSTPGSP